MSKPLINITRGHALCFAAFLVLYQFLTYIANDMIMPGMIHVINSFNGPESAIATSLTAYVLGGASLQLFLGPISDCYGRRNVMLVGTVVFVLFTFLISYSHSITQFLWLRYFEGLGLCFTTVVGYAVLQEIFVEMEAVRLTSILGNVSSLAPLLGPLAGATYILYFPWQGMFMVIGGLALVALLGLWRYMPETIGVRKEDGTLIERIPLTPKVTGKNYLNLLTNKPFMLGALAIGLLSSPCIVWIALSPIIIVKEAHLTVIDYALWQLPIFAALMLGSGYLRYLTHHKKLKYLIALGSSIAALGLLLTWLLPTFINSHFIYLMPGLLLYSFGMGIAYAPLNRFVLFATPVSKGTAYAVISMINMSIQALAIEIGAPVYAHHNNSLLGVYYAIVGVIYLLSLACMFPLAQKVSAAEMGDTAA